MSFHGLSAAVVAQVLVGAGAAVTALYLLRLRRRRVQVPFAMLWARLSAETESRSLLKRLTRLLSWLLALLLVALLGLSAGDPRPTILQSEARTLVLLLDASASMRATDGAPTRFESARAEARRILDSLRPGDLTMLVRAAGDVEPLTPLTADVPSLRRALDAVEPAAAAADLGRALRFAAAALQDHPGGRIVLLTDGAGRRTEVPAELPALSVLTFGERADNVSILAFNVRHYRANRRDYEVFLRVRNDGEEAARCKISIHADGALSEILEVEVPAKRELRRLFGGLAVHGTRLVARLSVQGGPGDLLDLDNTAHALLPETRAMEVGLVTKGNLFLEAALLLNDNLRVTTMKPHEYPGTGAPPDAWVFDRFAPAEPPAESTLWIAPPAEGSPWPVKRRFEVPDRVRVLASHPLTRWVALPDLNAGQADEVRLGRRDKAIVLAGKAALMVAREDGPKRSVLWTFDTLDSDLPLRSSFPLLLSHVFEWFGRSEEGFVSSYRTGGIWRVPLPSEAQGETVTLVEPDGTERKVPVDGGRARVRGRKVGFHDLIPEDGPAVTIAASLTDPDESDLAPRPEAWEDRSTPMEIRAAVAGGRPPWAILALLALVWLALEWPAWHRRWTV